MKKSFTILMLIMSILAMSQDVKKGTYRGYELPFLICYFTYTDSTAEVEYFFKKSSHIFGHRPSERVIQVNTLSKLYFKSLDDSIRIYRRRNFLMVKRKKFANVKVRLAGIAQSQTIEYRRQYERFHQRMLQD